MKTYGSRPPALACAMSLRGRLRGHRAGVENGTLCLACDGDTDEIVVVVSERLDRFDEIVNDDSLADFLGKVIEQA